MNLMGLPENLRQGLHGLGVALPQPTAALLATCVVRIAPNNTCTACVLLPCPTQESRLRNRTHDRTPTKRTLHQERFTRVPNFPLPRSGPLVESTNLSRERLDSAMACLACYVTWVLAMVPAHSRCRACVWRPRPSTPHAQMAAASAHRAGGWRAGSFESCSGLLAASARCSTAAVWMSVPVAWLAASAAT